jgi:hypothetical protein
MHLGLHMLYLQLLLSGLLSALMPDIPILMPLLVAACIFSPLILSLVETERDSDSPDRRNGSNPPGNAPSPPPRPVCGDAHAVKIDRVELAPSVNVDLAQTDPAQADPSPGGAKTA